MMMKMLIATDPAVAEMEKSTFCQRANLSPSRQRSRRTSDWNSPRKDRKFSVSHHSAAGLQKVIDRLQIGVVSRQRVYHGVVAGLS